MQSTEQGLDPGNGPAGPEDAASRRAVRPDPAPK